MLDVGSRMWDAGCGLKKVIRVCLQAIPVVLDMTVLLILFFAEEKPALCFDQCAPAASLTRLGMGCSIQSPGEEPGQRGETPNPAAPSPWTPKAGGALWVPWNGLSCLPGMGLQ